MTREELARQVGRPADASSADPGAVTDVAVVVGQGRLPTDLAGELMDVLASEREIVVCDLRGIAVPARAADVLAPAAGYLNHWIGTTVVVCLSDPAVRRAVQAVVPTGHLVLAESVESGLETAMAQRRRVRRVGEQLAPTLTASREARRFVARTLLDWELPRLVPSATLVVSELVTNSVIHALTVVDLTLTQADGLLRVAVRDHGGGRPALGGKDPAESPLSGRGLLIVQGLTRSWGVFPGRASGKTVWAVLDAAAPRERTVPA
jgi:anti-sigma regulatory factor (Ser/Thr protein kinase)